MSDRPDPEGGPPLFQNMDEQERVYAPQQVPGAVPEPTEVDADKQPAAPSLAA